MSHRFAHLGIAILLGAIVVGRAGLARGQHGDVAAANALFEDGKRLFADRRIAEACVRFEASLALVPQLGVQLNLADCYERVGKTTSAWLAFGDAIALARRVDDHARWEYARQRQAALGPRLSRIVITIAAHTCQGLVVTRDGELLGPAAYGVEVPVDPGDHTIEAIAPGHVSWSIRIKLSREGEVVPVAVPELQPTTAVPAASPASGTPSAGSTRPTAAADAGRRHPTAATWIAASVGAAGLGLGAYLGFSARSLSQEARRGCDSTNACSDEAVAAAERSQLDARLSTATFAVAGVALGTALILYLRSPRERTERLQVAPAISSRAAVMTVAVRF